MKKIEITQTQIHGLMKEISEWKNVDELIEAYTQSIGQYRVGSPMWMSASVKTNWLVEWRRNEKLKNLLVD